MKQSLRYHHSVFMPAIAPPGLSFFLSFFYAHRTAFLFASMNSQKSKGKKQRGSFLTRSAEIARKRMNVRTQVCQNSTQRDNAVGFQGLGEYSPTQVSLAKTGHMITPNCKDAGKCSFPKCPDFGSTNVSTSSL